MFVDAGEERFELCNSQVVILGAIDVCNREFVRGCAYAWDDHVCNGHVVLGVSTGR